MLKINKKTQGFTLIELLAILVILGIIMVLAVASYGGYIRKADTTYYENLAETFKSAVIEYYTDTVIALPPNVGDIEKVGSDTLINKNYLEKLVDAKNKDCAGTGFSKKTATNKYEYSVCLACPSYNNNEEFGDGCELKDKANEEYNITASIPSTYKQGKDASGNFGNTIITIPRGEIVVDGQSVASNLAPQPSTINTKVPHNTKYTIYYQYQNRYISRDITIIDDTKPSAVGIDAKYESTNTDYTSDTWTKDNIVLTLTASDWTINNELYGAGVDKIQISSNSGSSWNDISFTENNNVATTTTTITEEGEHTYTLRAVDKAGNISPITSIRVLLDKTSPEFATGYPTVTTSDSSKEYNTTTPIINLKATDNIKVTEMCISTTGYEDCTWQTYQEQITYEALSKHLDGKTYTFYISVKDNMGNITKTTKTYKVATAGLACSTYAKKDSVSYAGFDWYVLSDNGVTTTLIKKTNSHSTQPYGSSTIWGSSNAKAKVTDWFNSSKMLTLEQRQTYVINNDTYGFVRIPTYDESSGIVNDSNTPYWTLTKSGTSMRYLTQSGGGTYRTYYTSNQTEVACYFGYRVQGDNYDSLKRYHQAIHLGAGYTTIGAPSSTSNYINWTYKLVLKPCSEYVADSSGKGFGSPHPLLHFGPYCADSASHGFCSIASDFCPANFSGTDTSNCTSTYRTYEISKNKGTMGLRPVIEVKERCD